MSNKTSFKRIALAVVAALGFGALATGPSNATMAATTLTIAATEATVKQGETATVNVTANWANIGTADSFIVTAILTEATGPGGTQSLAPTTDSVAVTTTSASATGSAWAQGTAGSSSKMVFKFSLVQVATVGTYTWTFYPTTNTTGMTAAAVTYKLTVTGSDRVMTAATSVISTSTGDINAQTSDSTVVASGLTAATHVASIFVRPTNAAGETRTQLTPASFSESITAVITGPGLVQPADASNANPGTAARSVAIIGGLQHLRVLSDGTGGTATISLYKGLTSTVLATETVSFSGAPATATLTLGKTVTSKQASDSQTVIRLVIKDATGGILPATSDSWFVHSSDTKVVSNATSTGGCLYSYSTATGYATCGITLGDTGTTKIKVANFAFGTAAASLPTTQIVSAEFDLRVVGTAATVGLAFNKTSYAEGEEATITLTAKDANGFVVPSQTLVLLAAGIDYSSGTDVTDTSVALTEGVKTYKVNVPTVGGNFVALIKGGAGLPTAGQVTSGETVTVINAAEDAANSALDAAQEATDAAIAATDAAILAQEAADEAASAAIAAQETAQAAVDAVTALSAEVTKLVAQLATLQKLLNRVAKRVGVKL